MPHVSLGSASIEAPIGMVLAFCVSAPISQVLLGFRNLFKDVLPNSPQTCSILVMYTLGKNANYM